MGEKYDLIVIGGGSAGLVAAGGAGLIGAKVALVEKAALGGDCLYTGCVPSKTLIRSARLASDMRNAGAYGFEPVVPKFGGGKFSSVIRHIHDVVGEIEAHDAPEVFEEMGVEVIFGTPRFLNSREIEVTLKNGGAKRVMTAKRFCVSTGSSPVVPPIHGLEETGYITNEDVFELEELPERLVIIGGGAIGVELGQSFQRFGSNVEIVEMEDRILALEDEEVSAVITEVLTGEGVRIRTATRAAAFSLAPDGSKRVRVESGGKTSEIACDEVLVAAGRKPNVDGLDLKNAGVATDRRGIVTDDFLRTTAKNIFAAGDITGHFQFTHMADYEAQIVLNNAFLFWPFTKKVDFSAVPWTTFCEPEVACVGLIEKDARVKYSDSVMVYKVPLSRNDRAITEGSPQGFAKLVLKGKKILGVTIVAPHAGELLSEFVVAIKHDLSLAELNEAIHVYPTFSKLTQALGIEQTMETFKKPWVQKWIARYLRLLR